MNPSEDTPRPLFRFLQMSDLHVTADPERAPFAGSLERARWLTSELAGGSLAGIDLVLCIGDAINGGSPDDAREDYGAFGALTQEIRQPLLAVPGNHETNAREGDPEYAALFQQAFGVGATSHAHRHGGLLFVMLDNSGTSTCGPEVSASRERWLRDTLEAHRGVPKILCCHVPLVPMRDPALLAESLKIESWMTREPEILALVEEHADSVVAVLSGHLHVTGLVCRQSIFHVTVSGTASFPSDYAVYSVFEDRIEVEAKQLPLELLVPATGLHGTHRLGYDMVDDVHPTHAEYLMGTYDERRFAMPIKRPQA